MGRLAGFRYREIVARLKQLGMQFDRQARGSHEIWSNPGSGRYTTIPNHPGDMLLQQGWLHLGDPEQRARATRYWRIAAGLEDPSAADALR